MTRRFVIQRTMSYSLWAETGASNNELVIGLD